MGAIQLRYCFEEYVIRDWHKDDVTSLSQYANNRKIWSYLRDAFPHPYTREEAALFIDRALQKEPRTAFAIASKSEAIGSIGLMPGQDVHRFTAELGYWLGEPFWGKGIMTEAVRTLSEYALNELGFCRIYAEPYTTNLASARVLEKSGFVLEGILRASVYKDKNTLNQFIFAKVK
jgi:RimJ/RimL family protein N-acetyltransferase